MIPAHPFADIFPLLGASELAELTEDIRRFGLRNRIVIFEGLILDGRNRYLAAISAGLIAADDEAADRPAVFQHFVPDVDGDPLSFVVSANIHRRHLSTAQRAFAMAEYEVLRHGGNRGAEFQDANLHTRADLAERAKVSERSIASAAVVRDRGVEDLHQAVRQGDIAISAAERIARLPAEVQREEVARAMPNGARAIMAARQEPDDSLDFFPTAPWATRALMAHVMPALGVHRYASAWEPACGEGHMAEVLREYFKEVLATDVFDYGHGEVFDFLGEPGDFQRRDWIITNPPFADKGEQFVLRALDLANVGVAMFFRLQWLETLGRYERVFHPHPPTVIAQFVERVPVHKGRWDPEGDTATAYLWIVWMPHLVFKRPTRFLWIPPGCREALTHADDVARFTARPVTPRAACDEPFDPASGEIAAAPAEPVEALTS